MNVLGNILGGWNCKLFGHTWTLQKQTDIYDGFFPTLTSESYISDLKGGETTLILGRCDHCDKKVVLGKLTD